MITIIPNICMSVTLEDKKLYKIIKSFSDEYFAMSSNNGDKNNHLSNLPALFWNSNILWSATSCIAAVVPCMRCSTSVYGTEGVIFAYLERSY